MMKNRNKTLIKKLVKIRGFSLIELSIVILILSFVSATAANIFSRKNESSRYSETRDKIEHIFNAIKVYNKTNGATTLCPARLTDALNSANFGVAQGSGGNCTGESEESATLNVVSGMLPVTTLGLPAEYAIDSWGNRFTYIIDEDVNADFAGATPNISIVDESGDNILTRSPTSDEIGDQDPVITPCDGSATISTIEYDDRLVVCPAILIISHGSNGYTAFNMRGTAQEITTYGETANQESNSPFDNDITGTFDNIFVDVPLKLDASDSDYFDDILVYRTKEQLN